MIRRVRQTMLATKLAHGALVAWRVPEEKLNDAFDFMAKKDPFSGHVVIRSTDGQISGSSYRLWTTLKVPQGESLEEHGNVLKHLVGAEEFILMLEHVVLVPDNLTFMPDNFFVCPPRLYSYPRS